MVLCDGRVLFLELKAPKGRLRPTQEAFRDAVLAQGFGWALVRSLDDALGALADHGFTTRIAPPCAEARAMSHRRNQLGHPAARVETDDQDRALASLRSAQPRFRLLPDTGTSGGMMRKCPSRP